MAAPHLTAAATRLHSDPQAKWSSLSCLHAMMRMPLTLCCCRSNGLPGVAVVDVVAVAAVDPAAAVVVVAALVVALAAAAAAAADERAGGHADTDDGSGCAPG